jgi:hypothetical protein
MKTLLLCALIASSGCSAALVEKLSHDTYWSNDDKVKVPHVSEHPVGRVDHFGVNKRLVLHNPTNDYIYMKVDCTSIYQPDLWYHVKPHSVRYALMTAPHHHEYDQTCFLMEYKLAPSTPGDPVNP